VKQFKPSIRNHNIWLGFFKTYFSDLCPFIKNLHQPIISLEHFVDIDTLMRNNNKTGVGFNSEKKTCRQKNNSVKNSSLPGGTWL